MDTCRTGVPFTGNEPIYDEDEWIPYKQRANCYAMAMNDKSGRLGIKSTPGLKAGVARPLNLHSCKDTQARVLADNPGKVYAEQPCVPCREGYYRAMMALDKDAGDFHFWRSYRGLKHKVRPHDTYERLARFYGVSARRLYQDNGQRRLRVGEKVQVNTPFYAQKRGLTETIVTDSCGRFLRDPRKAAGEGCMRYGHLAYEVMCNDLCVKVGGLSTR